MMGELEELLKQKKEIEMRIKQLRNRSSVYGIAKIDVEHYPTLTPDRHYLAVYYKPLRKDGKARWQTIFSAHDRDGVIEKIPEIIPIFRSCMRL